MSEGITERGKKMAAVAATVNQPEPDDGVALERLFLAHHGRVYRSAYRVTGNAGDAQDVLQTVFLRLARQGVADVVNPEAYLTRAAVNAALDLVRMRREARMVPVEVAGASLAEDARLQPERREQSRELREFLRQAVARLAPRAAEIFALRYFEGYENKEIAAMLGLSQTDVAVTLHRSRARLQDDIRTHLGDSHER